MTARQAGNASMRLRKQNRSSRAGHEPLNVGYQDPFPNRFVFLGDTRHWPGFLLCIKYFVYNQFACIVFYFYSDSIWINSSKNNCLKIHPQTVYAWLPSLKMEANAKNGSSSRAVAWHIKEDQNNTISEPRCSGNLKVNDLPEVRCRGSFPRCLLRC